MIRVAPDRAAGTRRGSGSAPESSEDAGNTEGNPGEGSDPDDPKYERGIPAGIKINLYDRCHQLLIGATCRV